MPLVFAAIAVIAVGCNQQREAKNDRSTVRDQDKNAIRETARDAKSEIDKEAKAKKDMLDAEAKAAQAKIDAEKAKAKAETTDAQSKTENAAQNIRDAAGAASAKAQTEVGTVKGDSTTPSTAPATTPAPPTTTTTTDSDQKLADQVRSAISTGAAGAPPKPSNDVQVSASGGVVTLKGTVASDTEKNQVETAAKAVPGVSKVDNQLQVKSQ